MSEEVKELVAELEALAEDDTKPLSERRSYKKALKVIREVYANQKGGVDR